MSEPKPHNKDESADPIESIVPYIPIVLPVAGGVMIFLIAFIAIFMA